MKTKDTGYIDSFKEYCSLLSEDKENIFLTFRRRLYIDDLNAFLRSKTKAFVHTGIGFLYTKIILVLPEKDFDIISFYRDWLLLKNIRLSDCYVTFLLKSEDVDLATQKEILKKELSVFGSNVIVLNHTEENSGLYEKRINHEDFLKMRSLSAKENLTEEEKETLVQLRKNYWLTVREVLNYKLL